MADPQPHPLDYATHPQRQDSLGRPIVAVLLSLVFAVGHFFYASYAGYLLWSLSGGIRTRGTMTAYGCTDWAWTTPAHLPGGVSFAGGIWINGLSGHRNHPGAAGALGMFAILAGSVYAGVALALLVTAAIWRDRPLLSRRGWRLWCVLIGWAWLPVPAEMSWVYQCTVVY